MLMMVNISTLQFIYLWGTAFEQGPTDCALWYLLILKIIGAGANSPGIGAVYI